MEEYLKNGRICPMPIYWNDLYKIIVGVSGNSELPKPLILAGWNFTGDEAKLRRFKGHLEIIEMENITTAINFLDQLEEEAWYKGYR